MTTSIMGQFVIPRLTLDIFYLFTKFGETHFSRFGDMIAGVKIKNASYDRNHASFRDSLSSVS